MMLTTYTPSHRYFNLLKLDMINSIIEGNKWQEKHP